MLGLAVVEINAYVGRFFASFIPATATTNAVAVLDYAYEVIQAPAGIFAISIATAIFPLLAAHAATDAREDLRTTAMLALRTLLVIILPISALAVAAREPLIGLLFERGMFTGSATQGVATAAAAYALGLPAIAAYYVVTRAYYALQDMATPVRVGIVMILLNAGLDYLLMRVWGAAGIALATSIVATVNVVTLLYLLRSRLDGVEEGRVRSTTVRAGSAALISGVAISAVVHLVAGPAGSLGGMGRLVQLAAAALAGGAAYLLLCRAFGVSELGTAWAMVIRRPMARSDPRASIGNGQ